MKTMKKATTAIIGGGASGLFCAASLRGDVFLLERGERVGRKLSATGNGQGNVTNINMSKSHYFSSAPDVSVRLSEGLSEHGEKDMLTFFQELGGLFLPDERGRVYPAGRQASSVTDLLRYAVAAKGVSVRTGVFVTSIEREKGDFKITAETPDGKEHFFSENVVLCTGGKAAKNFGSDGNGYALAKSFGHSVTDLYPSLVQLKTETAPIRGLKGIRVEADVSAYEGREKLGKERGDVIFTDYGVSGDAIFRLSAFLSDRAEKGDVVLSLAFLPEVQEAELVRILENKQKSGVFPEGELLCGILNNQLGRAVMRRCDPNPKSVAAGIKNFTLRVSGTLGFDYAQVTKGGIRLTETDATLQSRLVKGLYFAGEILDVDGECGGYNLQWAYTSARLVADALNERRKDREA